MIRQIAYHKIAEGVHISCP